MKKFVLEITCENDVFQGCDTNLHCEIARIIESVSKELLYHGNTKQVIQDFYGNRVGYAVLVEDQ